EGPVEQVSQLTERLQAPLQMRRDHARPAGRSWRGRQMLQRTRSEPTVKPAPTEVHSTRLPFFNRPSATASSSASGIVAAVVLPYRPMLITTFSSGKPSRCAADWMM